MKQTLTTMILTKNRLCKSLSFLLYITLTSHAYSAAEYKKYTVIFYVAADNNLYRYAEQKVQSLAALGSNQAVNFVMHLDLHIENNKRQTFRYYFDTNQQVRHINQFDKSTQAMDSGAPETLISCCQWAVESYPAENYILIIWNHGSGPVDPIIGRITTTTPKPKTKKPHTRGICWSDSTKNYLNNQKLEFALSEIKDKILYGEKFKLIGFDACLMGALEIANITKEYADVMVASQEVEWVPGWHWTLSFQPLHNQNMNGEDLAKHIVSVYEKLNNYARRRYTLSALNLNTIEAIENNLHEAAGLLIIALAYQKNNSVNSAITTSRHKKNCTYFDEPAYLDLHHLYQNLLQRIEQFSLATPDEAAIKEELKNVLQSGCQLIEDSVIANATGTMFEKAKGISIYFPESGMHPSYPKTKFGNSNSWLKFLKIYDIMDH
ncbi:MAG TPA: clostripain-related cysteine peptidase [Candidatus Babeliales bacterium]|nr:clostripain-related cysteine peptidase [Candidatus Babeliales bacterium]